MTARRSQKKRSLAQLEFTDKAFRRPKMSFGGADQKSHPKTKRPLDSKLPMHVVLRSSRGGMRRPRVFGKIENHIFHSARANGIRIYRFANVGNHLHLLIRIPNRKMWSRFIRRVTGPIALWMCPDGRQNKEDSFWLGRPFSRVVSDWGKAYRAIKNYIYLNFLEAEGMISRRETKTYADLKMIWSDA